MEDKAKKKGILQILCVILLTFLLLRYWDQIAATLTLGWKAALPLLTGCIIAYVVNILMSFYEARLQFLSVRPALRRLRRPLCIILAFSSILLIVVIVVRMVIPELLACLHLLLKQIPDSLASVVSWADGQMELVDALEQMNIVLPENAQEWQELLGNLMNLLASGVNGLLGTAVNLVSSVTAAVVTFAIGLVFSFYLLMGKEKISGQLRAVCDTYLPKTVTTRLYYLLRTLNASFHHFIAGQCIEAFILGALCTVGMLILGLPYAGMIGSLVGCTALIPVAGAYIGAAVGAFMIFTVSPVKAVVFLIFLVILQQLEGNLIYPKVVGSSLGLPGIWVLAAVTVGGGVAGIAGILLGIPLAAALYQLLKNDIHKKRRESPQELQDTVV